MQSNISVLARKRGKGALIRGGRAAAVLALAGIVAIVPAMSATAVSPEQGTIAGGIKVTIDVPGFTKVDTGMHHSVALASDGSVWSWGSNEYGQLGDGSGVESTVPVKVDATAWGARTITSVVAGWTHSVALAEDGTVWAWGNNDSGQMGNGTTTNSAVPVQVDAAPWGARTISTVTAGSFHSAALAADGTVWTWGYNLSGQLGEGSTNSSSVPVQVNTTSWGERTITGLAEGSQHSLVLASDGTVWAWGGNTTGQLGNGTTSNDDVVAPVQVDATPWGSRTITSIAASNFYSAAVASDGTVWAWGSNDYGQFGNGSKVNSNVPSQVNATPWGERTITGIATGNRHVVALASDGTVWAWGDNRADQLGLGSLPNSLVPAQVDAAPFGERAVTTIAAGDQHSAALTSDGTVWAWGNSSKGQIGNGSKSGSNVPAHSGWTVRLVTFGGALATDIVTNSDGTVTVTAPAHAPGAVDVVVGTRFQNADVGPEFTTAAGFTYVTPANPPVITTTTLPDGTVTKAYSAALAATGKAPFNWTVTSGALPTGVKLDAANGKLSGTPTKEGTFKFTVTAKDAAGSVAKALSITVRPGTTPACVAPRSNPVFADSPLSHKFYKEIDWMECMKYSTGWRQPVGKPLYKPADNLERQAMAAFIFRMEAPKNYKAPKVSPFADVQPGDSYYKEMAWMYEAKLSTGYREASGKPTYRPHASLTREAMAAFIYRLEAPKNYTAPKTSPLADMKPGMSFYKEISWMYSEKLSTGNKVGATKEYWPKDDLSRQAMAAFIYRLVLDYRPSK